MGSNIFWVHKQKSKSKPLHIYILKCNFEISEPKMFRNFSSLKTTNFFIKKYLLSIIISWPWDPSNRTDENSPWTLPLDGYLYNKKFIFLFIQNNHLLIFRRFAIIGAV